MTAVEPGSISAVGKVNLSSTAFPLIPTVDAILVLGGGVPGSYNDPPIFVKERCDAAAIFFRRMRSEAENPSKAPAILTLSAGTAHMPQLRATGPAHMSQRPTLERPQKCHGSDKFGGNSTAKVRPGWTPV